MHNLLFKKKLSRFDVPLRDCASFWDNRRTNASVASAGDRIAKKGTSEVEFE